MPVASKARAVPEHEWEVPKVDLNRNAYQYSLRILAEQIAIYNRGHDGVWYNVLFILPLMICAAISSCHHLESYFSTISPIRKVIARCSKYNKKAVSVIPSLEVRTSYFARFFFISSVAASICSLNHSYSASFPFLHFESYSLSHLISILDNMAMNDAWAFVAPMGIELKCSFPLGIKNAVLSFKAWFIFTRQYPASRSVVM